MRADSHLAPSQSLQLSFFLQFSGPGNLRDLGSVSWFTQARAIEYGTANMKIACFSPFTAILLVSASLTHVLARPSPHPKAPWVKSYLAEKAKKTLLKSGFHGRRWENSTYTTSTVSSSLPSSTGYVPTCADANAITAPKENVWGGLTDVEAAGVTAWLFAQAELNLTISEDAGEWDNVM